MVKNGVRIYLAIFGVCTTVAGVCVLIIYNSYIEMLLLILKPARQNDMYSLIC